MNKMFLVLQREFTSRVKKKSFLLATILVPLIFPAMIGGMIYLAVENAKNKEAEVVQVLDESELFKFEDSNSYIYKAVEGPIDSAKNSFQTSEDFALLYIPEIELFNPEGIAFYSNTSPGVRVVDGFEDNIAKQIKDMKLGKMGLSKDQLDSVDTYLNIDSRLLSEGGEETKSSEGKTFWTGYVMGMVIYIFLFAYGAQVMQGVIEEKNSKIVEVIVSTTKPFQMMVGKVLGVASVGIFQVLIWVALMGGLTAIIFAILGLSMNAEDWQEISKATESMSSSSLQSNEKVQEIMLLLGSIPFVQIITLFIFYFLGGYLLYGALFAAVGSAVDTPADAQQFMMPIMLPIIGALMGLFLFVFEDPHGPTSFWLSIIPFTSPIVMMGRIGFGVPWWEIALSMALLVAGFIFTLWVAGRIYRVGILMHGTKVNYKTLARWFMQKG